ncbi:MAG: prepilin peptidase [Gemmatimonadales bacterium]|nr:prepilin peptidase [Candidatus Palauibacter irciniicola]MYC18160.1 prepilin peptidase [Gemmatimonadales bacterium]
MLGAALGSFLNVCITRMPAGDSVLRPRSRCPACRATIRWRDNLPVLSWIFLRAKCRDCGGRIPVRYPAIELATALGWAGMAWLYGTSVAALTGAVLFTLLLAIAVIDARHYIIPDALSLGGCAAGLALSALPGSTPPLAAVAGAVLGFGLLHVVGWLGEKAFRKPALGGGDVKMMAMVGAFLGPGGALLTIFLGALAGSLVYGPVSLRTGKPVPFGTFLALGAAISFLFGDTLFDEYLRAAAAEPLSALPRSLAPAC